MPTWFKQVFGFAEPVRYSDVQARFQVHQDDKGEITLVTKANPPRSFYVGKFETPSVQELHSRLLSSVGNCASAASSSSSSSLGRLTFAHGAGEAYSMHLQAHNAGAVFQAASQFNCLEMVSPAVTPADGITRYAADRTQGPACALACPAATVYRNYFVHNGQGQGSGHQIDTMQDVGRILGNHQDRYWKMKNGYLLPTSVKAMSEFAHHMTNSAPQVIADARHALRVGVHWSTQVSNDADGSAMHNVTQVYCSAIPIGYSQLPEQHFEPLAQLVLQGLYEATLGVAAVLSQQRQARVHVYLTKVGGGVFGNPDEWIAAAICRALQIYQNYPLDVVLVHYGRICDFYEEALPPIQSSSFAGNGGTK